MFPSLSTLLPKILAFLSNGFWWSTAHPGEAIAYGLGLLAFGKAVTVGFKKYFGRHHTRLADEITKLLELQEGVAGNEIALAVPPEDPSRQLMTTAAQLNPGTPLAGHWSTNLVRMAIPGSRGRRQRAAFDNQLSQLLYNWTVNPSPTTASLARRITELVTGSIAEYIPTDPSDKQITEASRRRFLAASGRKRRSAKRVAAIMTVVNELAQGAAATARAQMVCLHRVVQALGNKPETLERLAALAEQGDDILAVVDDYFAEPDGAGATSGIIITGNGNNGPTNRLAVVNGPAPRNRAERRQLIAAERKRREQGKTVNGNGVATAKA